MENLALYRNGSRPYVSSISYNHHASRINDGIRPTEVASTSDTAWVSASEPLPQWAAVVFARAARVDRVVVYWGKGRMPESSRRIEVQGRVEGAWAAIAARDIPTPGLKTELVFDPVQIEAVRIWQDADGGPESTPGRMHVAQLEAYGDFVEDRAVDYLKIRDSLREEWERNFQASRREITREVLERIDRSSALRSGTGPVRVDEIARARRNRASTAWGRAQADRILNDASWWLDKDDEFIYRMIPTENPRAISPSYERGCPIHGGGRKCMRTNTALEYRWQCVIGGEWWYNGAVVQNPATGEPVEVRDDDDGWTAPEGFPDAGTVYHFNSAWRYYALTKLFFHPYELTIPSRDAYTGDTAILQLSRAYAITGDERYAHRAGVMLNRLAEVYRYCNGTVDEQRPLTRGYVVQVSWEEMLIYNCMSACDLVMDSMLKDEALLAFFRAKGDCDYNSDGRVDFEDIRYNIRHNLFGYMYEWLHRAMAIQTGDYIIREGLVLWALGEMLGNEELVDEAIEGRYGLAVNLTNNTFRDGKWWYDAPGYSVSSMTRTILDRLFSMKGTERLRDPRLRIRESIAFARNIYCDGRIPAIGDTGGGDSRMKVLDPLANCDVEELAYIHTGDDEYRSRLLALSEGDVDGARERYADANLLFHADAVAGTAAPHVPGTTLFHDSGIAILRTGSEVATRKHLVLNYGKGSGGHGHRDKLSINLIAFGYDLACDLGYPTTFTHKKVDGWEKHTASHATVCIDGRAQEIATGSLRFFGRTPGMQAVCASGERAYPECAGVYERTLVMVDAPGSDTYVFDLFRVRGGATHDYMFRSLSGDDGEGFSTEFPAGTKTVRQPGGTAAGEDVAFGTSPGPGYIKDVTRRFSSGTWSATWRAGDEDSTGIRLTMLGHSGREIINGKGEGFGFFGQSPWDACVAVRQSTEGGESIFTGVLEPFQGEPFVRSVEAMDVSGGIGARVCLDGRTDYVYRRLKSGSVCTTAIDGVPVAFDAEVARIVFHDSGERELQLLQGTRMRLGDEVLECGANPAGRVDDVDPEDRSVILVMDSGDGILRGDLIVFSNPAYACNSSYEVTAAEAMDGNRFRIGLSMSMKLSEGVVRSVDRARGLFATDTCMTKLEACPGGLFDGKAIHSAGRAVGAIETAGKDILGPEERTFASGTGGGSASLNYFRCQDPRSASRIDVGDRFLVCDLNAGDRFEVMRSVFRTVG